MVEKIVHRVRCEEIGANRGSSRPEIARNRHETGLIVAYIKPGSHHCIFIDNLAGN